MVTLEQVKLLESRVSKAIGYIHRLTEENRQLEEENKFLKDRIGGYEDRIGELETLVLRFREDQGRIEEGILSALDRLNQIEDAADRGGTAPSGEGFFADPAPVEEAFSADPAPSGEGFSADPAPVEEAFSVDAAPSGEAFSVDPASVEEDFSLESSPPGGDQPVFALGDPGDEDEDEDDGETFIGEDESASEKLDLY